MSFSPGEVIDIPAPIDVHTHLREPGGTHKETIASGTEAGLFGGYQAVFDMPNNPGGNETWSEDRLHEKYEIAGASAQTNIGFYAGANLAEPDPEATAGMLPKAAGLKLYFGHTTGNTEEYVLDHARPVIDVWISRGEEIKDPRVRPPILLHAREGVGFEVADYVASHDWPVHWCHLSTESEANLAARLARMYEGRFFAGVTPHHFTMTSVDADFKYGWPGGRMMPPLGSEADHDALIDFYNEGIISILETDHAPHTGEEKLKAESENPKGATDTDCTTCFGVSSIEFVLPVMMSLVQRGKISMDRLVDSLHTQPARMLGLKTTGSAKTTLEIKPRVITEEDRAGMSSNNPYVGWTGWARVIGVEFNGQEQLARLESGDRFEPRILRTGSYL